MDHPIPASEEEPAAEGDDSKNTLDTTHTGELVTDHELGGATCTDTRASGAVCSFRLTRRTKLPPTARTT